MAFVIHNRARNDVILELASFLDKNLEGSSSVSAVTEALTSGNTPKAISTLVENSPQLWKCESISDKGAHQINMVMLVPSV